MFIDLCIHFLSFLIIWPLISACLYVASLFIVKYLSVYCTPCTVHSNEQNKCVCSPGAYILMGNRDNKQRSMSGDNGFCEEKQNRVMGVEDDGGRKPLFFFTKVVREVLSKERNIIRELWGKEGVSDTDSHLVIS